MRLSEDLAWRGLIKDKTFSDMTWLDKPRKFYLGIDASSDSLTIGNLAVLMLARHLLDAGWQTVLLAGGATSLVGDPGGKDEERDLKGKAEIAKNIEGIKTQIEKLFAGKPHEMVNNLDWLEGVGYLDFLRDIGKHFPMTELMQREFVSTRMGESGTGISYAEFSYSLLQGYDFWWMFNHIDVVMQIGASDQWGNILSGVNLIRKKEGKEAQAFCMPLVINKSTGKKFGKSEAGAVWLDPERTTPTQFYQFWMNVGDDEVEEFLKIYTLLPKEEIEKIVAGHKRDPQKRLGQRRLAHEITSLVHGQEAVDFAAEVSKYLTWEIPIEKASDEIMVEIRKEIPSIKINPGTPVIEALVEVGLASSKSDARRLIQDQGVYRSSGDDTNAHLEAVHFRNGRLLLRRGKAFKDSALVEL